jgi:hypothetical protein
MPAGVGQRLDGALNDLQQRFQLRGGAGQIVRGQQPEGDDFDPRLAAPAEQLEDVVGAPLVAVADVGESRQAGPAAVAVEDDTDVPRPGMPGQGRFQPALIQPVREIAESHPKLAQPHSEPTPAASPPAAGHGLPVSRMSPLERARDTSGPPGMHPGRKAI